MTALSFSDGATSLPLATRPIRQDEWVLSAVEQKVAKNYASGTPAVLVVQLHYAFPLLGFEVQRIASAIGVLGPRFRFAALWVVNNYGDPPVKIPCS